MYGAQTSQHCQWSALQFENDVEMYGAQTFLIYKYYYTLFENDVEMYGAQTGDSCSVCVRSLRMM